MPKNDPAGYLPLVKRARQRASDGDMRSRAAIEMARRVATLRKGNPKRPVRGFRDATVPGRRNGGVFPAAPAGPSARRLTSRIGQLRQRRTDLREAGDRRQAGALGERIRDLRDVRRDLREARYDRTHEDESKNPYRGDVARPTRQPKQLYPTHRPVKRYRDPWPPRDRRPGNNVPKEPPPPTGYPEEPPVNYREPQRRIRGGRPYPPVDNTPTQPPPTQGYRDSTGGRKIPEPWERRTGGPVPGNNTPTQPPPAQGYRDPVTGRRRRRIIR